MLLKANIVFIFLLLSLYSNDCINKGKKLNQLHNKITIRKPMANFKPIFEKTEAWEGGYQNYPTDKANYTSSGNMVGTNRGISAIAYENYLGYEPTVSDIKAITRRIAENVYRKKFWAGMRGDDIKSQDIADIIFAIRIGNPAKSNKIVEESLRQMGKDVNVKWTYSDEVIKAINRSNPKKLYKIIKEEKRKFLESLRYSYPQFINGWMRKLESFEYGGPKKKWLIRSLVLIALVSGSYYLYKKGYHKKIINQIGF